jgi:hypothetical protein
MNINIPNSVIWENAYKVILAIGILIACFTNDAAYNIGQLFTISLVSVGAAHLIFKKKTEFGQSLAKAIASLIPFFVAASFIVSDKTQEKAMHSIQESLAEQKSSYEKLLDGNNSKPESNTAFNKPISMAQFKGFKAANSKDEMLQETAKLIKLATQQGIFGLENQTEFIKEIKLFEAMQGENLINVAGAQNLKNAGAKYGAFIAQMKSDSTEFNAQYKATFYLISANFPAEISGFDKTFSVSVKNQNKMYAIQIDFAEQLQKMGNILITGYKNQQVKYDPATQKLTFLNDGLLNSYNAAIEKIEDIAKQEEEITQSYIKNLSKYEKSASKVK